MVAWKDSQGTRTHQAICLAAFFALLLIAQLLEPFDADAAIATLRLLGYLALAAGAYLVYTKRDVGRLSSVHKPVTVIVLLTGLLALLPGLEALVLSQREGVQAYCTFACLLLGVGVLGLVACTVAGYFSAELRLPCTLAFGAVILLGVASVSGLTTTLYCVDSAEALVKGDLATKTIRVLAICLFAASLAMREILTRRGRLALVDYDRASAMSDRERLAAAFKFLVLNLLAAARRFHGEDTASLIELEFNSTSESMQWPLSLTEGQVETRYLKSDSIGTDADLYATAVAKLIGVMNGLTGTVLVHRTLVHTYDQLHWEERELLSSHVFGDTDWAARLSPVPDLTKDDLQTLVKQTAFFANLTEAQLDDISSRLIVEKHKAGQAIVKQGESGDKFYLMRAGTAEVLIRPPSAPEEIVGYLREGDYFGEIALLTDEGKRIATVKAVTDVETVVLAREHFARFVSADELGGKSVMEAITSIRELRNIPLFAELDGGQLAAVIAKFQLQKFPEGATVITQGEVGRRFYVIKEGEVGVHRQDDSAQEHDIAVLGKGEYFGEIALLQDVPRTATIRTRQESELWVLEKEDFQELLASHSFAGRDLELVSSRRVRDLRQKTGGK